MQKIRMRRRIHGTLTPAQQRRLEKARDQAAKELPDLIRRNQMRFEARKEKSFSGLLRRAIHRFPLSPMKIAERAEIEWADLADFLTGEKTLPSDAIDRLVTAVKLKLPAVKATPRRAKAG
jgi:hypothetical protein